MNPLGWTPVGPSVIYNGQLTGNGNAPVSGRCTAILVHPTDPNTVYAGTASGGVWKTTDAGNNWQPIMDDQINLSIGAMAFDPNNANRLYVATGEGNPGGEILAGGGLLIYDATSGAWTLQNYTDLVGRSVRSMVIKPGAAPYTIWLATDAFVVESTDGGAHFTKLQFLNPEKPGFYAGSSFSDIAYNAADDILYAAAWGDGVYQRVGAGAFTKIPRGPGTLPGGSTLGRIALGICKNHPQNLYVSYGDSSSKFLAIYFSADKGATWTAVNLPSPSDKLGQSDYNHYLAVDPDTPTILFFGELKLWRSTDGGTHWTDSTASHNDSPGIHSDQHCLAISPSDKTKVWAGNDGGVWFSSDSGVSFFSRNRGLQTFQYYSLAQHPDDASILLAGAQDNGSQRYEGHPAWDLSSAGDGFFCAIDSVETFRWYSAYVYLQDGKIKAIQRSEKAGKAGSWDYVVDGISNTFNNNAWPFYVPFVIDPTDHHVLYLGTNSLYRSDHFGDNWQAVYTDPATKAPWMTSSNAATMKTAAVTITAIAVNPTDGTHVYVGTADGNVFMLQRQADGSYKVTQLAGLPAGGYISDLAVAPPIAPATTSYVLYAALGSPEVSGIGVTNFAQGRIFMRNVLTDANWTPLSKPGLDRTVSGIVIANGQNPINAITVDPDNPKTIYIGCDSGVFRTTDQGANWSLYSDNLPNVAIADLQFHRKTKLLRAATMGRSIWEIDTGASAASPPATTIFIRRNIIDTGRDPLPPADAVDPFDPSNHINPFSGADIKIDTPLFLGFDTPASFQTYGDTNSGADYIAFPQLDTSNVLRRNKQSRLYAEVMNRGPADATNVVIRAFYAAKVGNKYPNLPADFWTKFPSSDPDLSTWKTCGAAVTLGTIRAAQPKVAMWELPETPPATQDPVGVLVVATSTEDPVGLSDFDPNTLAVSSRHLVLREASVNMSTADVVVLILLAVGAAGLVAYGISKA